jgi:signal transduction histidine kinase
VRVRVLSNGLRYARRRGLAFRVLFAGGVMALLSAVTFGVLSRVITELRDADTATRDSTAALISAGRLERLLFDLDAGSQALAPGGDRGFQQEYDTARSAFNAAETKSEAFRGSRGQAAAARRLVQADNAYVRDHLGPLMTTARNSPLSARSAIPRSAVQKETGTRRLATLRDQGTAFENAQRTIADAAERRSAVTGREAVIAVAITAGIALLLIFFFVVYVTRVIVRPVRRVALMAGDRDESDVEVRMPEASPGEVGLLKRELNTMVASLAASQSKLRQVADMQGALRRVATLVACGSSPSEVFTAVAAEVGHVLGAAHTVIVRFESDETANVVSYWNDPHMPQVMPPLDGHWPIEEGTVTGAVRSTERPARMNDYERNTSAIGRWARLMGLRCVVGCPVKVEGRVWGAMIIHCIDAEPVYGVTEDRMQEFVGLVGTAIANAQSRSDLLSSRARVVAAADESRRRIERDLHDGAQQRLVTLALKLRTAADGPDQVPLRDLLDGLVHDLSDILDDLQEVSRGIVPPILTRSGLPPALRSLARRSPIPVRLQIGDIKGRLPERVEVAVFYTVSEGLTNVVKHAHASEVCVDLDLQHETIRLAIRDDGCGGADLSGGTGLVGLKDRVEALNGYIAVTSPPGDGTSLLVAIPIEPIQDPDAESSPP